MNEFVHGSKSLARIMFFTVRGDFPKALNALETELKTHPRNSDAWHKKAIIQNHLGNFDEAFLCIDRALELSPIDGGKWYTRACSLLRNSLVITRGENDVSESQSCLRGKENEVGEALACLFWVSKLPNRAKNRLEFDLPIGKFIDDPVKMFAAMNAVKDTYRPEYHNHVQNMLSRVRRAGLSDSNLAFLLKLHLRDNP